MAYDYASSVLRKIGTEAGLMSNPIAASATIAVGAIAAVGAASIKQATAFDQAMHKVAGLTNVFDDGVHTMQWYSDQLLALAPQIDVAPTALAQALYFVASAGMKGQQAIDVIRYSAMAAASTMGDMGKVADLVTSAMNAYANQGLTAAHATDVIMQAVKNGKVEMQALQTSFAFVATTGLASKFSIEEVAAAVSTLTHVSGNTAARRVQMDLDNLVRNLGDVGTIAKKAKSDGLAFNEAKFASEGFIERLTDLMNMTGFTTDTLEQMRKAAGGNEQVFEQMALKAAQNSTTFKSLAGGAAAMIPAVILMNDKGKTFADILKQMGTNGQFTEQAFKVMRESTGQQLNMFKVTLESLSTVMGLHLLPVVNKVLGALINFGRAIIPILEGGGWEQFKQTIMGIGIVAGTILAPGIAALVTAIAPFVLAIAGIVAAGVLIGKVVEHFGGLQAILARLAPLLAPIRAAFGAVGDAIHEAFTDPAIRAALDQLKAALPQLLPILKAVAIVVGVAIVLAIRLFALEIRGLARVLPLIIGGVTLVINIIGGLIKLIMGAPAAIQHLGGSIRDLGGHIKEGIGGALGSAGEHIGGFFSGVGSKVHGGLSKVSDGVQAVGQGIAHGAQWLYQHNYYVQFAVDFVRNKIQWLRMFVPATLAALRANIAHIWSAIQQGVQTAWTWIGDHITGPVASFIGTVLGALGRLKDYIWGGWLIILRDAQAAWTRFVGLITGLKDRITTAVHDHVIQPIQDKWTALMDWFKNAGGNLIKLIINGIKGEAGNLAGAAKNALGGIASWLGFHSPAPKVPESAQWGPNLIRMMALGIRTSAPLLGQAAQGAVTQLQRGLAGGLNASVGVAATRAGGAGGAGAVLGLGTATSGPTTINVTFPGVTNKDEIKQAVQELQQGDYRRARRAGSYQGTRAGI